MKIAYITSEFPYGAEDPFAAAEIAAMAEFGAEIFVVPANVRSAGRVQDAAAAHVLTIRPFAPATVSQACLQALMRPKRAARAAREVFFGRYATRAKYENALFFAKGIALARMARAWEVRHIHAGRANVCSTIAYIASAVSGIPWSCTARWSDVAENNMIASKAGSAAFIRAINARTRLGVVDLSGGTIDGRCTVVPPAMRLPLKSPTGTSPAPLIRIAVPCRSVCGGESALRALAQLKDRLLFECDVLAAAAIAGGVASAVARHGLSGRVQLRNLDSYERLFAQFCNGEYGIALFAESVPELMAAAMLAGVPCVVTAEGDELLENRCTVTVPQESAQIAAALAMLCRDAGLRAAIARSAFECARTAFDPRENTGKLLNLMRGGA